MSPVVKRCLKTAVTVAALAWLIHVVPVSAITRAVHAANLRYVATGLGLQVFVRVLAALRMKIIGDSQALGLSTGRLLRTLLTANFYSLLLPGTAAGAAATWVKYVANGAPRDGALVTIIVNRATAMATMIALGALAFSVDRRPSPAGVALIALPGVASMVCVFVLIFRQPHRLVTPLRRLAGVLGARWRSVAGMTARLVERMAMLRAVRTATVIQLAAISLLYELVATAAMLLFAASVANSLGFWSIAWIRAALQIVATLPISVAGLGVREITLVGLTSVFGTDPAKVVAWSLLIVCGNVLAALVGAAIEAQSLWRRFPEGADRSAALESASEGR